MRVRRCFGSISHLKGNNLPITSNIPFFKAQNFFPRNFRSKNILGNLCYTGKCARNETAYHVNMIVYPQTLPENI